MTPKDIADSRLARGEITAEEHRHILEQLAPDSTMNRRFAAAPGGGSGQAPPAAAAAAPPRPLVKVLSYVGSLALMIGLLTLFLRNQDANEMRRRCDASLAALGVNCECFETRMRGELAFTAYIPLIRTVTRPSQAEVEMMMARAIAQCRR